MPRFPLGSSLQKLHNTSSSAIKITHNMTIQVEEPSETDILCGRGGKKSRDGKESLKPEITGKTNHHPGNVLFRDKISALHQHYIECERKEKTAMTVEILDRFRSEGVRFLREDPSAAGMWIDVGDQLARTKISQALRDNTSDGTREQKSRGKRVDRSQESIRIAKRVKILEEPDETTEEASSLVNGNLPREVSPVPSASDLTTAIESTEKKLHQSSLRRRTSVILPPDASLFEMLEGSGATLDPLASKSSNEQTGPLILPELPTLEVPLQLPSIMDNDLPEASDGARLINPEFSLDTISKGILEDTPREVSPLPSSVEDLSDAYQPFYFETDDSFLDQIPAFDHASLEPKDEPDVDWLAEDTPLPSLLGDHERSSRLSFLLHRFTDGFSSISQLSNDEGFAGSKDSAFSPTHSSLQPDY